MQKFFFIAGIIIAIMGIFFACQGGGVVQWPASSFMVDEPRWVTYGLILSAIGLMIAWLSRQR